MKDSKFIELLNLYVDQQIEPEDAALLEEEILRHPARRRTYQQYCRMHRGCALLGEQSRPAEAGVGEKLAAAAAAADEKVIEFPDAGPNYAKGLYFGGLFAAAACALFVVITQPWKPKAPAAFAATVAPAPEQVVHITPVAKAPMAIRPVDYQPVLVAHSFRLNNAGTEPALANAADTGQSLGWMTQVNLAPLPRAVTAEDFNFETPASLRTDQNVFRSRRPVQGTTEQTAFQYQR